MDSNKNELFFKKIFNEKSSDITMTDCIKQSVKNGNPFVITIPKDAKKDNIMEMIFATTNKIVDEILNDSDCKTVSVVYIKG